MSASVRNRLDRFKELCLDPLPDEVLMDTHMNALLRHARRDKWRRAGAVTGLARAKLDLNRAWCRHNMFFAPDEDDNPRHDQKLVHELRQATAAQILVPAPNLEAVAWKKQAAAKDAYLPISGKQISEAIAADEAWLAAHLDKRPRRKATGRAQR